ncbi:proline-rich receptor-like protein kinase PERK3 [Momordica charantia]|uniref:non-specific serine/threonine protein kinase n=1 Tax=Momordica charantia TaxID=3673 RepID=A0A6J1CKI6_MOMCH|nr:proline-rich receptor-like protein kinase PERK3 [Momordica charantia]XP_022141447.1 proline-rich receptor-like protein kinase PERK3 [Momordica charantia]XP_022141448.1 proline-rich receptor-like protein kinase PERK3 [Momordica charantia]
MSSVLAAILGGSAGAVALVGLLIILIRFIARSRNAARTSETGSSDPSVQVGRHVGIELSLRDARHFEMAELALATNDFSENNLIGEGKFGEVYKGMLHDGMFVAIKKRHGAPSQDFVDEVHYLSSIQHRNLVTLLGYCQENNLQFLIFDYIPNGSVSSHIYGAEQLSAERLEFKIRLSIALGAAKGLAHIHSMSPRLIHKNFKTSNVLVDENFIAKVADAGLYNVMGRTDISESSSRATADEIFLAPEVKEFRQFSEKSDVYSFGIFLLELVSGQKATDAPVSDPNYTLVDWIQTNQKKSDIASIADPRLGKSFTDEGMAELMQLILQCVGSSSERRPVMSYVVMELERILEKEMNLTTVMGEGSPTVTLGSQLFKASK